MQGIFRASGALPLRNSGALNKSVSPSLGERGRVLALPSPGNREHTSVLPPTWYTQASDGSAEADSPSEVGLPPCSWVRGSNPHNADQPPPGFVIEKIFLAQKHFLQ
ncbi:hypothetical protein NDU88_006208 [Pleurodeles waltl]|uniref:Uncharacterized protein n=1 Tax=Pleurodeles waltl TaxID=8319 RepID=A0AAV7VM47_PLEWA|nr:hypothetical protein NDU88_006208 [Pleurodeles waltl]